MIEKALLIGYGSIGRRHADILSRLIGFENVTVLSSQLSVPFRQYETLERAVEEEPDYVIICKETARHYEYLNRVDSLLQGKIILVEKPLFASARTFTTERNQVWVAYNLRFHPILQRIKELVVDRPLWSVSIVCGSWLPSWRKGRDYKQLYSASKERGGGVLLDLSHELDYLQWFVGKISRISAVNRHVSDLNIDSDDILNCIGFSESGVAINLHLNYFTKHPVRRIIVDGMGLSLQGDLVENTLNVTQDGLHEELLRFPHVGRDFTYEQMHRSLIEDRLQKPCTLQGAHSVMDLVECVRCSEQEDWA